MRECKATIRLRTPLVDTISNSLEPDNAVLPDNVVVDCSSSKAEFICNIRILCREAKEILRLRNTIDDILFSIKTTLSVIEKTSRDVKST